MGDIVLPVTEPFIKSYMHHSICFSIIDLTNISEKNWFSSNFINLKCPKDLPLNRGAAIDFKHETFYSAYDPLLHIQNVHKNLIEKYKGGIVDFLIDRVDEQNYVELMVNEYYIPGTSSYLKYDFTHNIFIYGYNKREQYFYARHMKHDLFQDAKLEFEVVAKSFEHAIDTKGWNGYSKVYTKSIPQYKFNPTRFQRFVEDYLHSRDQYGEADVVYGLKVYDLVVDYFKKLDQGLTTSDIRVLHCLWEHKKSMSYKVNYLSSQKIMAIDKERLHQFEEIENDALKLRNLHLKKIIVNEKNACFEDIVKKILELKEKELHLYDRFIESF